MNKRGSLKWLWVTLIIIGLVIFGPSALFSLFWFWGFEAGFGAYSFLVIIQIAIVALLIWGLVKVLSNKERKKGQKAYKQKKPLGHMKIQYLFYIVGVIFIFAAVWYFAREYIAQFPNIIKLILLIASIIVSYVVAEFMRGSDL